MLKLGFLLTTYQHTRHTCNTSHLHTCYEYLFVSFYGENSIKLTNQEAVGPLSKVDIKQCRVGYENA